MTKHLCTKTSGSVKKAEFLSRYMRSAVVDSMCLFQPDTLFAVAFFFSLSRSSAVAPIFAAPFFQFDEDKYLFCTTDKFIVNKFRLLLVALSLAKVSVAGALLIFRLYWENVILHFSYWGRRTAVPYSTVNTHEMHSSRDVEWREEKRWQRRKVFCYQTQLIIEYSNGKANRSHIVCALCGLTGKVWAVWMRIWRGNKVLEQWE